jgi:hypothetical protein
MSAEAFIASQPTTRHYEELTMLKITDLTASKEIDSKEMGLIRGGMDPFAHIDFSTGITSKVAAVTQGFDLALAQGNAGAVTNNQEIVGGNGLTFAPVDQSQFQGNWMDVSGLGNVSVS